ncbi:tRNA selenocysteine 1-associated protein 1 [Bombina bombina]|uniref:tRNA selenocysteine 1-associated protein 1 n=1 Tax=Bombina bombina TaxID=8345 RepID=UPI00235AE8D1|nr:tRNA selenocysteine 1-associated protein 1 [Bombina bombina]
MTSLWMGDIEPFMTEEFITQAFESLGQSILSVKVIRKWETGLPTGYGFVAFADKETATKSLQKINGKYIPGTGATKRFKLRPALNQTPRLYEQSNTVHAQTDYTELYNYYNQAYQMMMYTNLKYDQKTDGYQYPQYGYTQTTGQAYEEPVTELVEEYTLQLDVEEANKQYMEQSEEFYDALIDCHWQPLDTVSSKIPALEDSSFCH